MSLDRTAVDSATRGHYLSHLGRPDYSNQNDTFGVHVDEFWEVPCAGAITLATRGLATCRDRTTPSGQVRHELLIAAWQSFDVAALVALLHTVANTLPTIGHLHQGDVLPPAGPLVAGATVEALLVHEPVSFAPGLIAFHVAGERLPCWWLVPVHPDEVLWIESHDVGSFLELLGEHDPDLLDLARAPVPSPVRRRDR